MKTLKKTNLECKKQALLLPFQKKTRTFANSNGQRVKQQNT